MGGCTYVLLRPGPQTLFESLVAHLQRWHALVLPGSLVELDGRLLPIGLWVSFVAQVQEQPFLFVDHVVR